MSKNSETNRAEKSNQKTKYITDRQVHEITGIGLQTLRNYRMLGKPPSYIKLNKSVRYLESDVIAFMESRRVVPGNSGNGATHHEK